MKPLLSAIVSLPVLAAATTTYIIYPSPAPPPIAYRQCDTSIVLCCNSLVSDDSTVVTAISELLEFEIEGAILPVGLTCDTIQTVGIFASVCSANPVCCQRNDYDGIITLGCTPIDFTFG